MPTKVFIYLKLSGMRDRNMSFLGNMKVTRTLHQVKMCYFTSFDESLINAKENINFYLYMMRTMYENNLLETDPLE